MTPFESILRPLVGDAYDTIFAPRASADPDGAPAPLAEGEQRLLAALAALHVDADALADAEVRTKVRYGLASAMKSIRRGAERRHAKTVAAARRGGVPLYRFRVTAPDGTELVYPVRGIKNIERRRVLIGRHIPKPSDQIEVTVREYYAPHLAASPTAEYTAKLEEAIARDIAAEIEIQAGPHKWRVWTYGAEVANAVQYSRYDNKPSDRWHYEMLQLDGVPFDAEQERDA